ARAPQAGAGCPPPAAPRAEDAPGRRAAREPDVPIHGRGRATRALIRRRWSARHLGETSLQEPALRLLAREAEGTLVGRSRVLRPAQAPAQIGARRVREAVLRKLAAGKQGIDEDETGEGPVA